MPLAMPRQKDKLRVADPPSFECGGRRAPTGCDLFLALVLQARQIIDPAAADYPQHSLCHRQSPWLI